MPDDDSNGAPEPPFALASLWNTGIDRVTSEVGIEAAPNNSNTHPLVAQLLELRT